MKILLASGGTKVKIDRVRHIGNMSKGTFGAKIGYELAKDFGQEISLTFLAAKDSKTPFSTKVDVTGREMLDEETLQQLCDMRKAYKSLRHYEELIYSDFYEYEQRLENLVKLERYDAVVLATAASDYLVANYVDGKIRSSEELKIELMAAPKLISDVKSWDKDTYLVGFKLLVDSKEDELIAAAKDSILKNQCDLVIANDLADIQAGQHKVHLVENGKHETFLSTEDPNYLAMIVAQSIIIGVRKHEI